MINLEEHIEIDYSYEKGEIYLTKRDLLEKVEPILKEIQHEVLNDKSLDETDDKLTEFFERINKLLR